jgi:hypothetical protein
MYLLLHQELCSLVYYTSTRNWANIKFFTLQSYIIISLVLHTIMVLAYDWYRIINKKNIWNILRFTLTFALPSSCLQQDTSTPDQVISQARYE